MLHTTPDTPPPAGPPPVSDSRPLLIALVAALVVLVAVVSYYLLVYVPARDARLAETPPPAAAPTERPPGALDEGDAFRPSVVEAPPPADDAPGLERPPQRSPDRPARLPATAPAWARNVAEMYLGQQARGSADDVITMYAPPVRYYSMGRVDAQRVYDDKAAYFQRFPERRYALAGPVRVVTDNGDGTGTIRFDYTFAVGGGFGGDRSGKAYVELDVVPEGEGHLISGERGDVY